MEKFDSINLIVGYIRHGLIYKTWDIGDKLPSENEICKLLNVSRSSVRCALAQYTTLGILKSVHGKGTYVCSNQITALGSGNISDALRGNIICHLEFRRMLEPDIAYYVSSKITPQQLEYLHSILDSMLAAADLPDLFVQQDCCFHLFLAQISGNPIAYQTLQNLFQDNLVFLQDMHRALGSCNAYYYHSDILKALESMDSSQARQLMRNHIDKSLSEIRIV